MSGVSRRNWAWGLNYDAANQPLEPRVELAHRLDGGEQGREGSSGVFGGIDSTRGLQARLLVLLPTPSEYTTRLRVRDYLHVWVCRPLFLYHYVW